jgi:DNA-directed RNA polymerase subunit RPC12/RpoP
MRLKLDLHPVYNDSRAIEESLAKIIDEAIDKRATEIEIIPGKGSGALKKTVIRFLDRADIKARYHRLEKDSDNWGRLFVHFKFAPEVQKPKDTIPLEPCEYQCFCCQEIVTVRMTAEDLETLFVETALECPNCGSPNKITKKVRRSGVWKLSAENGYE